MEQFGGDSRIADLSSCDGLACDSVSSRSHLEPLHCHRRNGRTLRSLRENGS